MCAWVASAKLGFVYERRLVPLICEVFLYLVSPCHIIKIRRRIVKLRLKQEGGAREQSS